MSTANSTGGLVALGRINVAGRTVLAMVGDEARSIWLRLDDEDETAVGSVRDLESVTPTVRIFQGCPWAAGGPERRQIAAETARLWRAHNRPHAPVGWKDADGRWHQSCSCGEPWPCDAGVRDCEG